MTPAARVAAAIEILDDILEGTAPEKALTGWGRGHRFAGSKDRAAIRDHVFGALRCKASFSWQGGANTGRAIMLGAMRAEGIEGEIFSGIGHAPHPVEDGEIGQPISDAPRDVRLDMPGWLLAHFDTALGDDADEVLAHLQARAGIYLRVNLARTTREDAAAHLKADGIATVRVPDVSTALQVIENERRVVQSGAFISGLVELQDPSSQIAVSALGITPGLRVLDYCAGGGGKALAMAALGADVTAHDIDPRRMIDIEPRAQRAGVSIAKADPQTLVDLAPFDLVLCDAPCSGSGTWRRAAGAKWDLTPERLAELNRMQNDVLTSAAPLVRIGGRLAYATCSVFEIENSVQIQILLSQTSCFDLQSTLQISPHSLGDGFFLSVLQRLS